THTPVPPHRPSACRPPFLSMTSHAAQELSAPATVTGVYARTLLGTLDRATDAWARAAMHTTRGWGLQEYALVACASYIGWHVLSTLVSSVLMLMKHRLGARAAALHRAGLYLNSSIHAIVTAGAAGALIFKCGALSSDTSIRVAPDSVCVGAGLVHESSIRVLLAFSFGYFLHDFVATMPTWLAYPADFVHHFVSLTLVLSAGLSAPCAHVAVHVLLCELSTPFFNTMWFMQKLGAQDSRIVTVSSAMFVLLFTACRILYLPYSTFMLGVKHSDFIARLPHAVVALLVLDVLNLFWFSKIVTKVVAPLIQRLRGGPDVSKPKQRTE
ncbi:hypothetical protein EON67_09790, partial [archaeon]